MQLIVMKDEDGQLTKGNEVLVHGVDYGTVDGKSALVFHEQKGGNCYLICKWKGHNYWSGVGEQSYSPTEFIVFSYSDAAWNERFVEFEATQLVNFEVR